MASSDASQARVAQVADQVTGLIKDEARDLPLRLDYVADRDDGSGTCDDILPQPGEDPKTIQWKANRVFYVDPPQETASRLDAVLARLVDDGWTADDESSGGGGRILTARRDGYSVSIGGDTEVRPGWLTTFNVNVYGPCIDAPASER